MNKSRYRFDGQIINSRIKVQINFHNGLQANFQRKFSSPAPDLAISQFLTLLTFGPSHASATFCPCRDQKVTEGL